MELSSRESLRVLMQGCGNPAEVRARRGAQNAAKPAGNSRKMRCKCGQCRQCLEDARWERIFTEKFADPSYYSRSVATHMASPLAAL